MNADRRDFIAGMIASLALCFAPYDRFVTWLAEILARVYETPRRVLYDWREVEIWINGQRFTGMNEIQWSIA